MLKARALLFALVVSLICAIVSGGIISVAQLHNSLDIENNEIQKNIHNINSGIALLLGSNNKDNNYSEEIDLYGTGDDIINIEEGNWGLFDFGVVSTINKTLVQQDTMLRAIFLGREKGYKERAIYLADRNKPLVVSGNTLIKGTIFYQKQVLSVVIQEENPTKERNYITEEKKYLKLFYL